MVVLPVVIECAHQNAVTAIINQQNNAKNQQRPLNLNSPNIGDAPFKGHLQY
jgi:hypothetical protein